MDSSYTPPDFSKEATIVVGIPGTWADTDALRHAIDEHSGGYSYSGVVLLHESTQQSFGVELVGPEPRLREAFQAAGLGAFSEAELDAIDGHTLTVYLIGEGGSPDHAKALFPAASALLKAGGLAAKVETTGKAFDPTAWQALTTADDATHLYDAFVLKVHADRDVYYTCGMHNLGFRDTIIGGVDEQLAAYALDVFSMYQILERPHLRPGESFSAKEDFPSFQLTEAPDSRFEPDDPLHNRYGLWMLHPIVA